jgi:hypothetical protein
VTGPARQRPVEIDIEHHAAEIEQQRVGGAGSEKGAGHAGRLRKSAEASNRRRSAQQANKDQHFDHRRTFR